MLLNGEMTDDEFDAWQEEVAASRAIAEVAGEQGGPRWSFLPADETMPFAAPGDLVGGGLPAVDAAAAEPFVPEPSRNRLSGWSARRQIAFIETLAETGSVHSAAAAAGLSARSAYQLRVRSAAFARAWDTAQQLAVGRLSALAFERAIHGRVEQVWKNGTLIGERRVPSERLLMWLLARLDPSRFAMPWERRGDEKGNPQAEAACAFEEQLAALRDTPAARLRIERLLAELNVDYDEAVAARVQAAFDEEAQAIEEQRHTATDSPSPSHPEAASSPATEEAHPAATAKIGKIGEERPGFPKVVPINRKARRKALSSRPKTITPGP
jgi:hypothetical protein